MWNYSPRSVSSVLAASDAGFVTGLSDGTIYGSDPAYELMVLTKATPVGYDIWAGTSLTGALWSVVGAEWTLPNSQWPTPVGYSANAVGSYKYSEVAALAALDYAWEPTRAKRWEWGGLVCRLQGGRYVWSGLVTSRIENEVDTYGLTSCPLYATEVANFHTHVPPGTGLPSGYFDGSGDVHAADMHSNTTFYIKADSPFGTGDTCFMRLRWEPNKPDQSAACNVWYSFHGPWIEGPYDTERCPHTTRTQPW